MISKAMNFTTESWLLFKSMFYLKDTSESDNYLKFYL